MKPRVARLIIQRLMAATKAFKAVALIAGVAFSVASCATSPTGRKQFLALPESVVSSQGAAAFQQLKQEVPTSNDPAVNSYVKCIVSPLVKEISGDFGDQKWEVRVFKDNSANAFALPGGKIGVHTGILKVARDDAQLAAVIGHEIGHVIARHGNERMSQALAATGTQVAVGALTKDNPNRNLIMGALGLGLQVGVLLPYSRTHESEADVIGLKLMSEAGFDPRESVELWKNMMKASGGSPPEFLSTHPSGKSRIENLKDHMRSSMLDYQKAQAHGKTPKCDRPSGL